MGRVNLPEASQIRKKRIAATQLKPYFSK